MDQLMKVVYLNDSFIEAEKANISIFDRGLLFGDSVYEVIPVYKNQPRFLKEHLNRLESNLDKAKIPLPNCDWNSIFEQLIKKNKGGDLQIYLQVTRGLDR